MDPARRYRVARRILANWGEVPDYDRFLHELKYPRWLQDRPQLEENRYHLGALADHLQDRGDPLGTYLGHRILGSGGGAEEHREVEGDLHRRGIKVAPPTRAPGDWEHWVPDAHLNFYHRPEPGGPVYEGLYHPALTHAWVGKRAEFPHLRAGDVHPWDQLGVAGLRDRMGGERHPWPSHRELEEWQNRMSHFPPLTYDRTFPGSQVRWYHPAIRANTDHPESPQFTPEAHEGLKRAWLLHQAPQLLPGGGGRS